MTRESSQKPNTPSPSGSTHERAVVVWFKRDLRVHDHAPLVHAVRFAAQQGARVIPLLICEPGYWLLPECSARQYQFWRDCAESLAQALAERGYALWQRTGDAVAVLSELGQTFQLLAVYAHEESGGAFTYARDRAVKRWLRANACALHEFRQFGVQRGMHERRGWAQQWHALMDAPRAGSLPVSERGGDAPDPCSEPWPTAAALGLLQAPMLAGHAMPVGLEKQQQGGRAPAVSLLESFVETRCLHYRRGMSSPDLGASVCSRLSPYLAMGCISVREAYQKASRVRARRQAEGDTSKAQALKSFISRLHWHCHFVQKLESEVSIEQHNINRGFDGLREGAESPELIARWAHGTTGWPFVDACMRSLNATGWLNFRMRAMLVAISSYQLWQHWREPGLHLARMFLDYEPGIHWSQVQMQSGVTGINVPRMYNPVKQSQDQDPSGRFIRRWLPELAALPDALIHTPWLADAGVLKRHGVRLEQNYPAPIIDHQKAARTAKAKLSAYWQRPELLPLAQAVLRKHGSKKRRLDVGRGSKPTKTNSRQQTTPPDASNEPVQLSLF